MPYYGIYIALMRVPIGRKEANHLIMMVSAALNLFYIVINNIEMWYEFYISF